MKDYDGVSESFCKRLYPKFAMFERNIRSLVLLILTEAYGSNWKKETVADDMLKEIERVAHGKVSLNTTLENMDLHTLENYLFQKREVNYLEFFDKQFTKEIIKDATKEELVSMIEYIRPTSLWQRHFSEFGSDEIWSKKIKEIHDIRNKVAHQKTITKKEYEETITKINSLNKELVNAIENIREQNFNAIGIIDILGNFALYAGKMLKELLNTEIIKDVLVGVNSLIQELVRPIKSAVESNFFETLGQLDFRITEDEESEKVKENINIISKVATDIEVAKQDGELISNYINALDIATDVKHMTDGLDLKSIDDTVV